jgi:signal transduction histidine kinase
MFSKLKERGFDRRGLRFRLTLMFSLVLAGALAGFSFMLYRYFIDTHQRDFDIALYNHAVDVAENIDIKSIGATQNTGDSLEQAKIFPFSLTESFLQIRASDGRVVASAGPVDFSLLPFDPKDFRKFSRGRDSTFETVRVREFFSAEQIKAVENEADYRAEDDFRVINFPLDDAKHPQYLLQIAVPLSLFEQQHENLRFFFFVSIPIALLFAAIGGFFLSGRALRPVDEMTQTANAIGIEALGKRLPVPEAQDELQRLALTMNQLLDRVEKALSSQERFVADASHQLLSPLAILRGELDVVREKDPEDVHRFFMSASDEIDRLSRTVRDMLILARADAGVAVLNMIAVELDDVVVEATARVDALARKRGVRLRMNLVEESSKIGFTVRGDRDLLLNLIFNLIENAVKYSPENALVDVEVSASGNKVYLKVSDEGPGIMADERDKVFERFYRSPGADRKTDGVGLGLAIAKKISELHGAKLSVDKSTAGGAVFMLELARHA